MFFYLIFFQFFTFVSSELELVQVLLRHGDRAPSFTYPSNSNFNVEKYFPRGFSQLTNKGFGQAKELGNFLRNRYSLFIDKFNRDEVFIRSSDKDRCIETAMGLTTTLFPSQIVPVHTFSHYKHDLLLKPNSVSCRRADNLVEKEKIQLFDQLNKDFEEFFEFLSIKTGWIVKSENIPDVYNVLYRMMENGVPQPSWVTENNSKFQNRTTIEIVVELKRIIRNLSFNSFEKSKLRTGFLLGQIINDMSHRIRHISKRKMIVYSSHDATLTSLMYSLGISNHQLPPYTAALMIEMHRIEGKRFVKILYRNSTINEPHELIVPGCNGNSLCSWSKFRTSLKPAIVKDRLEYENLCQQTSEDLTTPEDVSSSFEVIEEDRKLPYFTVGILSILDFFTIWKQNS